MKKRLFALALAAMTALSFAGCGSSEPAEDAQDQNVEQEATTEEDAAADDAAVEEDAAADAAATEEDAAADDAAAEEAAE